MARELHDDLTQRLAAAAIAAGRFRKSYAKPSIATRGQRVDRKFDRDI
jgi:signal transduction histidine kinase